MHIHTTTIRRLLELGERVYSEAAGRVGDVVGTAAPPERGVYLKTPGKNQTIIANFEKGDPVELFFADQQGQWIIRDLPGSKDVERERPSSVF